MTAPSIDSRHGPAGHGTLVLTGRGGAGLLTERSCRVVDRILARVLSSRLDRLLAAGLPPESARLLATRAQDLVSPATRRELGDNWEHLLEMAKGAPVPRLGRMALRREQIVAAEHDVREMVAQLRAPLPVAARGVAAASVLLTDGAGPMYNLRARSGLQDALRAALMYLEPGTPLFAST